MLSLEHLQSTVKAAILSGAPAALGGCLLGGCSDAARRFCIYQNNTRESLTATLMAVFPVTVRMVDERFFRYAADAFIRANPPSEPRLVRYGAAFPAFLREFDGLAEMPFVAEAARLEWAIAEALDVAALPQLTIEALDGGPVAVTPDIALQPSLRFVNSHWPVFSIWRAHQGDAVPLDPGLFSRRGERVALWRSGDAVRFALLEGATASFRASLKAGLGLPKAVSRALTHDPMFDLAANLVGLFADGLVTGVAFANSDRPQEDLP